MRCPSASRCAVARAGAAGVVGLHDATPATAVVDRRVDHDELRGPRGTGASRASADASLSTITPSTPCSRSRSNAGADAVRRPERHDGEGVAAGCRGIRHRLQHAGVADGRERRHDEPDRLRAAGAQRARRAVRAVAELGHRGLDAGAGGGIDARTGVDDARHRLARDAGAAGDVGHRRASLRAHAAPLAASLRSGLSPRRTPHVLSMLTLPRRSRYRVDVNTTEFPADELGAGVVKRTTRLADGRELIYYDDPDTTLGPERAVDARDRSPGPTPRRCAATCSPATGSRSPRPGRTAPSCRPPSSTRSRRRRRRTRPRSRRATTSPCSRTSRPRSAPRSPPRAATPPPAPTPRRASTTSTAPGSAAPAPRSAAARSCASAPSTPARSAPRPAPARAPSSRPGPTAPPRCRRCPASSRCSRSRTAARRSASRSPTRTDRSTPTRTSRPRTTSLLASIDREGADLFARILEFEQASERVILDGEHWTAFVPFAARWPLEVHLLPHRHVARLRRDDRRGARRARAALPAAAARRRRALRHPDPVHRRLAPGAGAPRPRHRAPAPAAHLARAAPPTSSSSSPAPRPRWAPGSATSRPRPPPPACATRSRRFRRSTA